MRKRGRLRDFLSTLMFLGILALIAAWVAKQSEVSLTGTVRVVDGDSLVLQGEEIRLQGIDAPEFTQACRRVDGSSYDCGRAARRHLLTLLKNGKVVCRGWEKDKYQRLLAHCSAGEVQLNRQMVLDGWAVAFGEYLVEEQKANAARKGLWNGDFQNPAEWRRDGNEAHQQGWLSKLLSW